MRYGRSEKGTNNADLISSFHRDEKRLKKGGEVWTHDAAFKSCGKDGKYELLTWKYHTAQRSDGKSDLRTRGWWWTLNFSKFLTSPARKHLRWSIFSLGSTSRCSLCRKTWSSFMFRVKKIRVNRKLQSWRLDGFKPVWTGEHFTSGFELSCYSERFFSRRTWMQHDNKRQLRPEPAPPSPRERRNSRCQTSKVVLISDITSRLWSSDQSPSDVTEHQNFNTCWLSFLDLTSKFEIFCLIVSFQYDKNYNIRYELS